MKIGIITMHGVKNFGSFLQTYATQKMLESLGHDVSVIHYMSANRRFKSLLMHLLHNGNATFLHGLSIDFAMLLKPLSII